MSNNPTSRYAKRDMARRSAAVCILLLTTPSMAADPEVTSAIRFTEVAVAAGIDFVETIGDDDMTNIVESAGVGCGFLDYDGDGWIDIYLVNGFWMKGLSDPGLGAKDRAKLEAATDRLYRNRGDGTFEDVTASAGLAKSAYGMGIVVADYDADGDPDFYVTNFGRNSLYRNNGDGTFTDVARAAGVDDPGFSVGAAFFDYNGDGRLDLYVGNYVDYDPNYKMFYAPDGFPGPLAYTGQQDRLFRADPDGKFTDVTKAAGLEIQPTGRAMGLVAFDYNGDDRLDVFVSNDAMENYLLHNKGDGTFENVAMFAGVAFGENGEATAAMGVEVGDYNGDGRFDLFVPDMTFCCVYRNVGNGMFEDQAARSGVAAAMGQYVGWSGVFADYDLDGNLDLYVANGDVHHLEPHEDVVFAGDGKGRFTDVSETIGPWSRQKRIARGAASADFDNDGDIDILITHLNDRPALLRNDSPRKNRHWLGVDLIGQGPNRSAMGAVIKLTTAGRSQLRLRRAGGGYLSQHAARTHFGLGDRGQVDELEIRWPDGTMQMLKDIRADRVITIRQPAKIAKGSR